MVRCRPQEMGEPESRSGQRHGLVASGGACTTRLASHALRRGGEGSSLGHKGSCWGSRTYACARARSEASARQQRIPRRVELLLEDGLGRPQAVYQLDCGPTVIRCAMGRDPGHLCLPACGCKR